MNFDAVEMETLKESVLHRRYHYERITFSDHASPEEKHEASVHLKRFKAIQIKLEKEGEKWITKF